MTQTVSPSSTLATRLWDHTLRYCNGHRDYQHLVPIHLHRSHTKKNSSAQHGTKHPPPKTSKTFCPQHLPNPILTHRVTSRIRHHLFPPRQIRSLVTPSASQTPPDGCALEFISAHALRTGDKIPNHQLSDGRVL